MKSLDTPLLKDGVFYVGVKDWNRRLFDALIPLPQGTTYNAYLIKGTEKTALIDTVNPGFEAELESKINSTRLRVALRRSFSAQIDLRQIGPRDVAKLIGGMGACGIPRCCSTFLTDFSPISIKMAKAQGISLNPSEITGMCGRLRCCLIYEYEQYVEARKQLPKRNKRIGTPHGEGKVIDVHPLSDAVTVIVEDTRHLVQREDIIPLEEFEALKAKAEAGCSKHESGGCDCGARGSATDVDDSGNHDADAGDDSNDAPPQASGRGPAQDSGPDRPASDSSSRRQDRRRRGGRSRSRRRDSNK